MSALAPTPGTSEPNPAPEGGSGSGDDGGAGGTQAPAGFVPQADLERVEAARRKTQGEADRLRAELEEARRTPTPAASTEDGGDFDPNRFRSELMRDFMGATALVNAAVSLRTEFPHANPALFEAERLGNFRSVEAFRLAVEDSHTRVATVLERERTAIEERVRAEFAEKYGDGGSGGPAGTGTENPGGDPTPEALARMSIPELNALDAKNPGVVDRVLRSSYQT